MAIVQISKIQVRMGESSDLPVLSPGEFGYALNTKQLFIGNEGSVEPSDNTEILTIDSPLMVTPGDSTNGQILFNRNDEIAGTDNLVYSGGKLKLIGDLEVIGTISGEIEGIADNVSGIVAIENGGTGKTTQQEAINALSGTLSSNTVLRSDGTNVTLSKVVLTTDVSGVLPIANGGTGLSSFTAGYVKSDGSGLITVTTIPSTDITGDISGKASNVTGVVAIENGGTGSTTQQDAINALSGTQTANTLLRSDGTNVTLSKVSLDTDVQNTLPISSGGTGKTSFSSGYLKSDGVSLTSVSTVAGSDVNGDITGKASNVTGIVAISNGGTGRNNFASGYLKSDGTALSSSLTIPGTDITGDIGGNAANVNGIIPVSHGGTNLVEYDTGDLLYASGPDTLSTVTIGSKGQILSVTSSGIPFWTDISGNAVTGIDVSGGETGLIFTGGPITTSGTITMSGTLSSASGGTGISTYTKGDIIVASANNVLSKTSIGETGQVLTVNSDGVPAWSEPAGSSKVKTIQVGSASSTHYLTIVDSNNTESTEEMLLTSSKLAFNPSSGKLTLDGGIQVAAGSANGIQFPNNAYGGSGDAASITLEQSSDENTRMRFKISNEADDYFEFSAPDNNGLKMNGYTVWHSGNDGANSGLDADSLDGLNPSTTHIATVSTIVSRDTTGYSEIPTLGTQKIVIDSLSELYSVTGNISTSGSIDSFNTAEVLAAKYLIHVVQGGSVQTSEILVTHNGTTSSFTEYGVVDTAGRLFTVSTTLSGGQVSVVLTLSVQTTSATFKAHVTVIV
jgi:hypothetical protein